jgi:hypothetical protein
VTVHVEAAGGVTGGDASLVGGGGGGVMVGVGVVGMGLGVRNSGCIASSSFRISSVTNATMASISMRRLASSARDRLGRDAATSLSTFATASFCCLRFSADGDSGLAAAAGAAVAVGVVVVPASGDEDCRRRRCLDSWARRRLSAFLSSSERCCTEPGEKIRLVVENRRGDGVTDAEVPFVDELSTGVPPRNNRRQMEAAGCPEPVRFEFVPAVEGDPFSPGGGGAGDEVLEECFGMV